METEAFLDTGCSQSVVGGEFGELLLSKLGDPVQIGRISTRLGNFDGEVHRIDLGLSADGGSSLAISATVMVTDEQPWPFPPMVLGYTNALERVRFALDPGLTTDSGRFYFGNLK